MLVIGRKEQEAVLIGDDIKVTVTRISGNQVRLGIEAPDWVLILREEVKDRETKRCP
jgi:carbon storage regulator